MKVLKSPDKEKWAFMMSREEMFIFRRFISESHSMLDVCKGYKRDIEQLFERRHPKIDAIGYYEKLTAEMWETLDLAGAYIEDVI